MIPFLIGFCFGVAAAVSAVVLFAKPTDSLRRSWDARVALETEVRRLRGLLRERDTETDMDRKDADWWKRGGR